MIELKSLQMKPYFSSFTLAALIVLGGCATGPRASTDPQSSSFKRQPEQVSVTPRSIPRQNAAKAVEINGHATLDDLLLFAAENSPALRSAFGEWKAAIERIPQARSLPDPNLSYGYFIQHMDTRQIFGLSQMFPWFGKLKLAGGMAEKEANAAAARVEAEQLRLFRSIRTTYAELAYLEHAIRIAAENQQFLHQFEQIALARLRAGETGDGDVLRGQMEIERLADQIRTLEGMRQPFRAELNAALGRPANAELPPAVLPDGASPAVDPSERTSAEWLAGNPRLRTTEYEIARGELGVDLARLESRPDVTVGVEFMDNRGMRDEVMLMASVNLPIWRERYAAARRQAQAVLETGEAAHAALFRELEAELQLTFFRLHDAQRKVDLYSKNLLPLARQTAASLEGAYRAGRADFFDLIIAQQALLEIELTRERAFADRFQQQAALAELTGFSDTRGNE